MPPIDERKEPDSKATQPSMPESKKTVNLPAMTDRALMEDLRSMVKDGFRQTNANIDLVSTDLSIVKDRVAIIESWKNDSETRMTRTSGRVQQASQTDMAHDAQLANERSAREALAKKVDAIAQETSTQTLVLGQLLKLTEKPVVKLALTALGSAVLTWLSTKGLR